jgi:hypothetical protein
VIIKSGGGIFVNGEFFFKANENDYMRNLRRGMVRVSVQGVKSLWGDCRFIPVDLGS